MILMNNVRTSVKGDREHIKNRCNPISCSPISGRTYRWSWFHHLEVTHLLSVVTKLHFNLRIKQP